jgi:YHS domain-containing protein
MLNLTFAIISSVIILLFSTAEGIYIARHKSITEMYGMMIGMTQGMMTGIAVGYFAGATSDMFIGNLVGVAVGLVFGIVFGRVGGLMGMMDGGMGGMMGGMMGAMLGVMLQYLYSGRAVVITAVLVIVIYFTSMIALVRLVKRGTAILWEIDPVCRMKVDPKGALKYAHQNHTYYFCAPSCRQSFAESPEAYIKK